MRHAFPPTKSDSVKGRRDKVSQITVRKVLLCESIDERSAKTKTDPDKLAVDPVPSRNFAKIAARRAYRLLELDFSYTKINIIVF